MVRGLAALFAAGATLVALTVALPYGDNEQTVALLAPCGAAYLVAGALFLGAGRVGDPLLHIVLALGTLLVAVCVMLSGRAGGAYAFMFVWVGGYAAAFFTPRAIAAHIAWAGAAYAAALAISGDVHPPAAQWLMALGTTAVAAGLFHLLTRQVRARTRDVAALAALATDLGGIGQVSAERVAAEVCEALLVSAAADTVVLLEQLPDGSGLHVIGMAGSPGDATVLDEAAGVDALDRTWRSGEVSRVEDGDHRRVRGFVQPVHRDGRATGLLAVVWRRPRRDVPTRVADAAALFAGQAGAGMERVEREKREGERRALEINDEIVQGLVVAKYAISGGRLQMGEEAIEQTLARAKVLATGQIVRLHGDAIRPGVLRRRRVS